ncbi:hypothetical protein D3C78_1449070 [compost metagenome]
MADDDAVPLAAHFNGDVSLAVGLLHFHPELDVALPEGGSAGVVERAVQLELGGKALGGVVGEGELVVHAATS